MKWWFTAVSVACSCVVASVSFGQDLPCGGRMASYQDVPALSNGPDMRTGDSCAVDGIYGAQYQCVEYVKRFYATAMGFARASSWHGNGNDYYRTASAKGLVALPNGGIAPPAANDIIAFEGGDFGHVAIVSAVGKDTVEIVEQNWSPSGTWTLPLTVVGGHYTVGRRGSYTVQGWLRIPSTSPPANQPPAAVFSTSIGSEFALSPGELTATADPITGQVTVTFTDQSVDPDGPDDISSRVWTVNTQSAPLCIGTLTCVWGFRLGGPYVVTLTVTDTANHSANATATINVLPAESSGGPPVMVVSPSSGEQVSTPFSLPGSGFTPGGIVGLLAQGGDGTYRKITSINADAAGNINVIAPIGCTVAPGTVRIIAIDYATWLPGDLNGDGIVNTVDYSILNGKWFTDDALSDLNGDGIVNSIDASILNANWLRTGTPGRISSPISIELSASAACAHPDISHLPNTGEAVGAGANDPYWSLLSGPTCSAGNCSTVASTGDAFSRLLVPDSASADPAGDYVYRLAFNVDASELSSATVSGRWATDDHGLDIRLNGVSTGQQSPNTFEFSTFHIAAGFVVGPNSLDFVVHNQDCGSCAINPVSLRVEFRDRPRTAVWPVSGRDPQRSGRADYGAPTAVPAQAWSFSTTAPLVGDIVVGSDQTVYFVSDDLYALNPDGTVRARGSALAPGPFITGPAIDENAGYVYVGRRTASGWEIVRFDRLLSTETTVAAGTQGTPSSLMVDDGTVFFFNEVNDNHFTSSSQAYAIGQENWVSNACSAVGSLADFIPFGWQSTPAVGLDGNLFGACFATAPTTSLGWTVLVKLDRATGAVVSYAPYVTLGAGEMSIDGNGLIRIGYQGFGGASFFGSYDRFDQNLGHATSVPALTSSRASFFGDTTSSVRIGGSSFSGITVTAEGGHSWNIGLSAGAFTAPTVDRNDTALVGSGHDLVALRGVDGSTIWTVVVDGDVKTQPVIPEEGVVYIGTSTGTVYKFVH